MTARDELLDAYGREVKVGDYVEIDSVVQVDYGVVVKLMQTHPDYDWITAMVDTGRGKFLAQRACCEVAVIASGESLGLGMLPLG